MPDFATFVPGRPIGQGSMRHVGRGKLVHDNPRLKQWREAVGWAARAAIGADEPILSPAQVAVRCTFVVRPWRSGDLPDIDKLLRAVLDALTGVAFENDKQVAEVFAERFMLDVNDPQAEGLLLGVEERPSPFALEAKAKLSDLSSEMPRV